MVAGQLASHMPLSRKSYFPLIFDRPNETQFNSFLFNATLLNFFSTAIIYMTCLQLDLLVNKTYIYQLLKLTGYTTFFRVFNKYQVFSAALLGFSILTLLTLLIKGGSRLKFSELEKTMEKDGKGSKKRDDDDD